MLFKSNLIVVWSIVNNTKHKKLNLKRLRESSYIFEDFYNLRMGKL